MSKYKWHICQFKAERLPNCHGPRVRCEATSGRGQCSQWAVGGARYAWGVVGLCAKHLEEECGEDSDLIEDARP
jgi:hypothetical protein